MTWTPSTQQAVKEALQNAYQSILDGGLPNIEEIDKALELIREEEENKYGWGKRPVDALEDLLKWKEGE